jgi:hypothetical protein
MLDARQKAVAIGKVVGAIQTRMALVEARRDATSTPFFEEQMECVQGLLFEQVKDYAAEGVYDEWTQAELVVAIVDAFINPKAEAPYDEGMKSEFGDPEHSA